MADNDQSLYNLRYNQISMALEGAGGIPEWNPLSLSNPLNFPYLPLAGGTLTGTLILNKAPVLPVVSYTASSASPVTPNAPDFSMYAVVVDANLTINGPSSPTDGQKIIFRLANDASHGVTFAIGAGNFRFGTDITSYTATVSKTDYVGAVYNSASNTWDIVAVIRGF